MLLFAVIDDCKKKICDRTTTNCIRTVDDFVCVCLIGYTRLNTTHCEGNRISRMSCFRHRPITSYFVHTVGPLHNFKSIICKQTRVNRAIRLRVCAFLPWLVDYLKYIIYRPTIVSHFKQHTWVVYFAFIHVVLR